MRHVPYRYVRWFWNTPGTGIHIDPIIRIWGFKIGRTFVGFMRQSVLFVFAAVSCQAFLDNCQAAERISYYAHRFDGHRMSDGTRYSPHGMTCATREHPMHSLLRIERNGVVIYPRVTDRTAGRHRIDLPPDAFARLAPLKRGVVSDARIEEVASAPEVRR